MLKISKLKFRQRQRSLNSRILLSFSSYNLVSKPLTIPEIRQMWISLFYMENTKNLNRNRKCFLN